jgi:hypothetical protein
MQKYLWVSLGVALIATPSMGCNSDNTAGTAGDAGDAGTAQCIVAHNPARPEDLPHGACDGDAGSCGITTIELCDGGMTTGGTARHSCSCLNGEWKCDLIDQTLGACPQ